MKRTISMAILALSVLLMAYTADLRLGLSYDLLSFQSTPTTIGTLGFDLDYFSPPSGNVSMGLGIGGRWFSKGFPMEDSTATYALELYSCAVYRGKISESVNLEILSRGGVSIPNMKLDKTGYFAEANVLFGVVFYGLDIRFGVGLRMYSFGEMGFSQIPLKLSLGKVF